LLDDSPGDCWGSKALLAQWAIMSIRKGTPIAAIRAYSACNSAIVPPVGDHPELAIRARIGADDAAAYQEKVESTSAAPAIMNQVLTSWRLRRPWGASSRRFWVGPLRSVRCPPSITHLTA
jgi:hypothetical protein